MFSGRLNCVLCIYMYVSQCPYYRTVYTELSHTEMIQLLYTAEVCYVFNYCCSQVIIGCLMFTLGTEQTVICCKA